MCSASAIDGNSSSSTKIQRLAVKILAMPNPVIKLV